MTLRPLLDASAAHDAEYGDRRTSHLPMALVALDRLGADAHRLAAFASAYAKRLHPAPPPQVWPAGDGWPSRLGDPAAWPAYRALFDEWFDHEGATAVLPQVLPTLMQGVGAAAFHGPIRVAYALAAGHSRELADALAYWACRWFALPSAAESPVRRGPTVPAAEALRALPAVALPGGPIADRMASAGTRADVARCIALGRPAVRTDAQRLASLHALAELAASLYAASGNFTVRHLVTSAHAVRMLLPWLDEGDRADALDRYWAAYVAGACASGLDLGAALSKPAALPLRPWPALVAHAVASDDVPVIELIDICRQEERHHGGTAWQAAATRAVVQ